VWGLLIDIQPVFRVARDVKLESGLLSTRDFKSVMQNIVQEMFGVTNNKETLPSKLLCIKKALMEDEPFREELEYHGELVGELVMIYAEYVNDVVGYNCTVDFHHSRHHIVIKGKDLCLKPPIRRSR